jgi:rubrerythrin
MAPPPAIRTLDELKAHLQIAIELEHTTIPAYLTALYTIRPGFNAEAAEILRSVVVQEMLHLVLAANVLNAVGGEPAIDTPEFIPSYPAKLPVGHEKPVVVNIRRFSKEAVDAFVEIEKPDHPASGAPATARNTRDKPITIEALRTAMRQGKLYGSIGDFYEAITEGLQFLEQQAKENGKTIFTDCPQRQVTRDVYYNSGGEVVEVNDIDSALEALAEIVDQGEGYGDTIEDGDSMFGHQPSELSHYARFNEIKFEHHYGPNDKRGDPPLGAPFQVDYGLEAVWPMIDNPNPDNCGGRDLVEGSDRFSRVYTELLKQLHAGCNGQPTALIGAVQLMFSLRDRALDLIRNPIPGTEMNAGPCFRYLPDR